MIKADRSITHIEGDVATILAETMTIVQTVVEKIGPKIGINSVNDFAAKMNEFEQYTKNIRENKVNKVNPQDAASEILKQAHRDSK